MKKIFEQHIKGLWKLEHWVCNVDYIICVNILEKNCTIYINNNINNEEQTKKIAEAIDFDTIAYLKTEKIALIKEGETLNTIQCHIQYLEEVLYRIEIQIEKIEICKNE